MKYQLRMTIVYSNTKWHKLLVLPLESFREAEEILSNVSGTFKKTKQKKQLLSIILTIAFRKS